MNKSHTISKLTTLVRKTPIQPPLNQSPNNAPHTLNHTTLSYSFPQEDPGGIKTWYFLVPLLPVESPQAGYLKHRK